MRNRETLLEVLAAAIVIFGMGGGLAGAAVLHVANNGTDSLACGPAANPCRSISQAIANASAGDRIVVGPGRYGPDVEPGGACFCMVLVDKAVILESEEGAGVTVIDASGSQPDVVDLHANNIVFGKTKHGFGIRGGENGLALGNGITGLKASGNLVTGMIGTGIGLCGGTGDVFEDNLVSDNGVFGFKLDCGGGTAHTFKDNVVTGNGSEGFSVKGTGHLLTGNLIINNGEGAGIGGTGHVLTGNAVLGNKGNGIALGGGASATIIKNNIYGNDLVDNCGLANFGGSADATKNFWGSNSGPGADPADDVCGGSVVFAPFATKDFPVSTSWK